jgi:hypothetical protein
MLLGLLGVYHARWGERNDALEQQTGQWLHDYQGSIHVLCQLARITDEVVGRDAALRAARSAFEKHWTTRQLLEERRLATNTPYAFAVAGGLLNANLHQLERTGDLDQARYICEKLVLADQTLIRPKAFADAVKRLIALSTRNTDLRLRDTVKDFVLRKERFGDLLGDPRRHPSRWDNLGLSAEAEAVKSWLSEEDLKFFFDLIMEGQEDRQHRREFWLRYVHRVRNSRVAIGEADRRRLRVQLNDLKKRGRTYAELDDWDASAFVMDFGPVIVVEFSQTGNACSVHEAKVSREKINLQADWFDKAKLKKRPYSPGWFRHDAERKWMSEVRQYLALFGVRE